LESEVYLRDVEQKDLPILFEHQREPEANQMASFPARSRDEFKLHWRKILEDKSVAKKIILFQGKVAGNIVGFVQDGKHQVGYWLGKEFWGKKIATKALSQFLEYVDYRPLYACVAKHNVGSIRVLEKCGFTISSEKNINVLANHSETEEYLFKLEE
jgi:RimJ/RimL family protein N-acetyltransferase